MLVGLTATPERADGKDILRWFDDRIASEMRLWEALDQGLLCPFHYLGVGDGTDLRGVGFQRGRYVTIELEGVLTGDHVRARRILDSVREWVLDPAQMRALGFCVGVAARAVHGASSSTRRACRRLRWMATRTLRPGLTPMRQLRRGELRAIFTVDIFNEGVDIPEVDTLLLLRPTESATVFLQQLGRGLRWAEGKSVLTVLDFIGQAHAEYRFDIRYRAMVGGTRRQVERRVEDGFPLMPPGCAIRLDEISQKIVLENLRSAHPEHASGARGRSSRACRRRRRLARVPREELVRSAGRVREPAQRDDFHVRQTRRRAPARTPAAEESEYAKALGRMLHVDDEERYAHGGHG